ncbi:MAG TPA: hypothetical protein VN969_05755 [Streptosporangiaceae bacterium]|nr:hypothetical protein [Streptosporangiaceae bacterium]
MNPYGELARQHGASRLPEVYDGIRDPGWFFTVLGELLAADIDQLRVLRPGARAARLRPARELSR